MTVDDLTVNFSHLKGEKILRDWFWLIGKTKKPILLTASGDAFVQDKKDFSIHFLSTTDGNIQKVAETTDEFKTLLKSKDFVGEYFSVQMFLELMNCGRKLEK
jgi:hypothetical protein